MPIDDKRYDHCEHCGKLFPSTPGRVLCHRCAGEVAEESFGPQFTDDGGFLSIALQRFNALMQRYQDFMEDEEERTPLNRDERTQLLYRAKAAEDEAEPSEPPCTLCGKTSLEGSEFCFDCQSRLYRSLGDAAGDLFTRLEAVEQGPGRITSVLGRMEEARARTATSRINPVAGKRLRT